EEEDKEEEKAGGGLQEAEAAPLGPPVGADAESTRLSETVSVGLPSEGAVWLLADKCSVAAHLFGPQHRYCLRAIRRLCRCDVREIARPARAALRRRGFRLQLSLLRAAASDARASAAAANGEESVAWGLPTLPAQQAIPLDSYVPERVQPLVGLLSPRGRPGDRS
ncbi:unnamed protein product, partial [Laminaria digitata]